ncbi:hypothetical protein ACP70R_016025 [Stipagrostis hirtigluma subsp. patula]
MATKTRARRRRRRPAAEGDATPSRRGGEHAARPGGEETDGDAAGKGAIFLPPDLADGVVRHLGALESASFAAVCRSWAAIVSRKLADPAPHLLAFQPARAHRRGVIIPVPLDGGDAAARRRASPTPALSLRRVTHETQCVGATATGRLVLVSGLRTTLLNPLTGASRRIKKFSGYSTHRQRWVYWQRRQTVPVVPIGGDSFFHVGVEEVGIWRAEDDEWTARRAEYADSVLMAVLCGDSVYALGTQGFVLRIAMPTLHATPLAVPSLRVRDKNHTALDGSLSKGYLVEAGGEVFFVWPLFSTTEATRDKGYVVGARYRHQGRGDFVVRFVRSKVDGEVVTTLCGFEVYRLDMAEMRWVEQEGLPGDVALFVSRWSSFPVRASEKGCVSNCVYFVCDEGEGNTWGAFSLGERRMLFEHAIGPGSYKERLWFYPRTRDPGLDDLERRLEEIGYL